MSLQSVARHGYRANGPRFAKQKTPGAARLPGVISPSEHHRAVMANSIAIQKSPQFNIFPHCWKANSTELAGGSSTSGGYGRGRLGRQGRPRHGRENQFQSSRLRHRCHGSALPRWHGGDGHPLQHRWRRHRTRPLLPHESRAAVTNGNGSEPGRRVRAGSGSEFRRR